METIRHPEHLPQGAAMVTHTLSWPDSPARILMPCLHPWAHSGFS